MNWTINSASSLVWRQFDSEWIVFDEASGQTHLLDGVSAAILMCVSDGATGEDEVAFFIRDLTNGQSNVPIEQLRLVFSKLNTLGLIEAKSA